MPFDWSNFGNSLETGTQDLIANKFNQSPIGEIYNTFAGAAGAPQLIGMPAQQPTTFTGAPQQFPPQQQQQQQDPAQLHYNDWIKQAQQPAPDQPIQIDSSPNKQGKGAQAAAAALTALLA